MAPWPCRPAILTAFPSTLFPLGRSYRVYWPTRSTRVPHASPAVSGVSLKRTFVFVFAGLGSSSGQAWANPRHCVRRHDAAVTVATNPGGVTIDPFTAQISGTPEGADGCELCGTACSPLLERSYCREPLQTHPCAVQYDVALGSYSSRYLLSSEGQGEKGARRRWRRRDGRIPVVVPSATPPHD